MAIISPAWEGEIGTWSDRLVLEGGTNWKVEELLVDGGKIITLPAVLWNVQMSTRELFNAIVRIVYSKDWTSGFQIEEEKNRWKKLYRVSLPAFRINAYMIEPVLGDTPEDAVSKWIENLVSVLNAPWEQDGLSLDNTFSAGNRSIRFNPKTKAFENI